MRFRTGWTVIVPCEAVLGALSGTSGRAKLGSLVAFRCLWQTKHVPQSDSQQTLAVSNPAWVVENGTVASPEPQGRTENLDRILCLAYTVSVRC